MKIDRTRLFTRIIKKTVKMLYPLWIKRDKAGLYHTLYKVATWFTKHLMKCEPLSVVSHDVYCCQTPTSSFKVLRSGRIGYCGNKVYNESNEPQESYPIKMQDIKLYEHHNVFICGHSDIVVDINKGLGINDFCYNKEERLAYGDRYCLGQKGNMILNKVLDYKKAKRISKGIMISGLYSHNYYHAVLDNLIRLLALDEQFIDNDAVFIVDENTMKIPSLNTIFKTLTKDIKRNLVVVKVREPLFVEKLYYVSHLNYIITNMTNWSLCKYEDYVFDWDYMKMLRDKLLEIKSSREDFPKRIFLSRKNIHRRQYNEEDVLKVLKPHGFVQISPEEYTIEEQIALFNEAEYIVGASGAAFTNLLFCNANAKILIIQKNKVKDSDFSFVYLNGCSCRFYGVTNKEKILGNTAGFQIDTIDFMKTFHLAFDKKIGLND